MSKLPGFTAAAILLMGLGLIAAESMRLSLPENDFWWMMPAMRSYTEGRSAGEVFSFLFGAQPIGFAQPILKLYLYGVNAWLGPEVRWLVLVSVLAHAACAGLLHLLARSLGLCRREAWVASLLYLGLFAHFHAVLWTSASQHLFAVMTILLLLVLYLRAEARTARGAPSAGMFAAAVAVALAASLQRSAFIAPALIGAHILFCSRDTDERVRRYVRWVLPLGCVFFLYQTWVVTQVGDPVVTETLRKMPFPEAVKPYLVVDPMEPSPIAPWARTAWVWLAGAIGLGAGAFLLYAVPSARYRRRLTVPGLILPPHPQLASRKSRLMLITLVCAGVYAYWSRQDSRQLLLPYNLAAPFLAALASSLDPVRAALSSSSVDACHYLPAQVSPWSLLLLLGAGWFFWKHLLPRSRALILLPCWLLLFTPLTIHQVSSFPVQTPSRYFIYISPVVCIVLAALLTAGFNWAGERWRMRPGVRDILLWTLVCVLGLSNLAAIRVALFRGRLANTYLSYDDIRIASLVEEDIRLAPTPQNAQNLPAVPGLILAPLAPSIGHWVPHQETGHPVPHREPVYVSGVIAMPLRETWRDIPLAVPANYDNLSCAARSLSGGSRIRGLHPGEAAPQGTAPMYRVEGARLLRWDGEEADPFRRRLEEGIRALEEGRPEEARWILLEAARRRPFLLRYLLGPLRLLDLMWLTDGLDLRGWINRVEEGYQQAGSASTEKARQIRAVTSRELSDFALCLFLLSYLDHQRGEKAQGQHWLSQIQLLDRNPARVAARLEAAPCVQKDPAMRQFLRDKVGDPLFFIEPFFGKKEDYGFGRFLVRLVLHRDIQSSWDRRFSPVL